MTASTRALLWLTAILLGLLPLAADLDDAGTAAREQIAACEDAETDARLLPEELIHPDTHPSLLHSCNLLSGATAPRDRLLPSTGGGIPQGPALTRRSPRAPPIP